MGILATGVGAAEGLEGYLRRLLEQEVATTNMQTQKARTNEDARANRARESLDLLQMKESSAGRTAQLEASATAQAAQRDAQMRDDLRASLDDVMPGAQISPDIRNRAVELGAALPPRFQEHVIPDDFVGPIQEGEPKPGEVSHYTIAGKPEKDPQPSNAQLVTVKYQGKPIEALFDPRARTISYQGRDVTNEIEHYEKPPAPERVSLYQVGDQVRLKSDIIKDLQSGGNVPIEKISPSTRTMMEGARMIRPHISELQGLAEELNKRGMFGPVMSRIRDLAAKLGTAGTPEEIQSSAEAIGQAIASDPALNTDELVGQFATSLGLMTSGMGRVHGGARGGGSIQMIDYLKTLLSGSSSLPMFRGRLRAVESYLKGYERGPTGEPEGATPPTGSFRIVGSRPK